MGLQILFHKKGPPKDFIKKTLNVKLGGIRKLKIEQIIFCLFEKKVISKLVQYSSLSEIVLCCYSFSYFLVEYIVYQLLIKQSRTDLPINL